MTVVKINAIHVPEGSGPELEKRFAHRAHSVDGSKGFLGFQLLRPVKGDDRYFVVTQWETEEDFEHGLPAPHARLIRVSAQNPSPAAQTFSSSRSFSTRNPLPDNPFHTG